MTARLPVGTSVMSAASEYGRGGGSCLSLRVVWGVSVSVSGCPLGDWGLQRVCVCVSVSV